MFKSKKKKIICACCAMSVALQAQNLTVSGTVKSARSNKPLQSANVVIENTDLGTFTDEDGRFIVKDIQSSEVKCKNFYDRFCGYNAKRQHKRKNL